MVPAYYWFDMPTGPQCTGSSPEGSGLKGRPGCTDIEKRPDKKGSDDLGEEAARTVKRHAEEGFSLLELLVVIAIGVVLVGMAIPMVLNAMKSYRLTAAVASATGAIQATRYQAIMRGYPGTTASPYGYKLTFTPSTNSYQAYNLVPPATTYSAVGTPVPISRLGDVTISRTVTYLFGANGTVSETSSPVNMAFQITNPIGGSKTITVSSVGNVTVTSP